MLSNPWLLHLDRHTVTAAYAQGGPPHIDILLQMTCTVR